MSKTRISTPKIKFTRWILWKQRLFLKGIDYPGVYLLAHFRNKPEGKVNPKSKAIIYIGETNSSLRKRWEQFNRAAFEGKQGHSGGLRYREVYVKKKKNLKNKQLYVAAFPVKDLDESIKPLFIRYIERKLIWQFVQKWGHAPVCNSK